MMVESARAISHFEVAIEHKELPSELLLYSIYSLMKEYETEKRTLDICTIEVFILGMDTRYLMVGSMLLLT